jgi:hypothetical protein
MLLEQSDYEFNTEMNHWSSYSKSLCSSVKQAHVYSGGGHCAAFLANIDTSNVTVQFQGQSYLLPGWSVSILPDCNNVVFNTAQVISSDDYSLLFW